MLRRPKDVSTFCLSPSVLRSRLGISLHSLALTTMLDFVRKARCAQRNTFEFGCGELRGSKPWADATIQGVCGEQRRLPGSYVLITGARRSLVQDDAEQRAIDL